MQQSLRTRRPDDVRKPQRAPTKLAKTPVKDARKSRVDDKIKKRMSMRYADISGPTDMGAVPAMPSLPSSVRVLRDTDDRPSSSARDTAAQDFKAADKVLDEEDFNPDAYLKLKLANSTEAELKTLQSSLRASKDDVASDLQRNVFKNYAEFVLISKEISTLENEMLELKENLTEWKSMPSLLHIDESASAAERHRNARSSVADLRVLYANQMQSMHAQIEGSAKFAPATSGRHVISEMDGIFALNAATFKTDHAVRFVVLDDAVLVARRRRRRNNAENGKLVAERCWTLSDMLVLDTKDSPNMTNVFKIRHGKETHVYRTEVAADKKTLLSQFRHVAEELAVKKRKEREGEHERRKSMWAGNDGKPQKSEKAPAMPDWMSDLAGRAGPGGSGAREKAERDARWVGEFADELNVAIALREWDTAVSLVEKGKAKLSSTPPLAPKLSALTAQLTTSLLHSLSSPALRKSAVVSLITLLLRLHAGPAARATFLGTRTEVMRKHVRAIRFEGHVGIYIADLAMVMFLGIKHTADWFLASFKENEVASTFIDWAKQQIESYAEMFRRQVYTSDVQPQTVDEAIRITYSQSKKLLQEYGLDFRFMLDELLVETPKDKTAAPFAFRGHHILKVEAPHPHTPSPTPRSRSPVAPARSPVAAASSSRAPSARSKTPTIAVPPTPRARSPPPVPVVPTPVLAAPVPRRAARSPPPALASPVPKRTKTPPASPAPRRARSPPASPVLSRAASSISSNGNYEYEFSSSASSVSSARPPRSTRATPVVPSIPRGSTPVGGATPRSTTPGWASTPAIPSSWANPVPTAPPVPRGGTTTPTPRASGGNAPPPRSSNRPGSSATNSHRPPPVAVPRREGMI